MAERGPLRTLTLEIPAGAPAAEQYRQNVRQLIVMQLAMLRNRKGVTEEGQPLWVESDAVRVATDSMYRASVRMPQGEEDGGQRQVMYHFDGQARSLSAQEFTPEGEPAGGPFVHGDDPLGDASLMQLYHTLHAVNNAEAQTATA